MILIGILTTEVCMFASRRPCRAVTSMVHGQWLGHRVTILVELGNTDDERRILLAKNLAEQKLANRLNGHLPS